MFIGLLPDKKRRIPDASMSLLSLILLNTANAIESLESYNWVLKQNSVLEEKVEERTKELVKYERQLQRAQKMEAIGTLAGGVAHDLNNILSGLVSYPELLLMDLPEDSPLRKPVQTIKKSGEKAAAIVQDLLTLARRGVAATEVVNLNDVISEYLKCPEFEKLQFHHPEIQVETNLRASLRSILASPVHLSKTIMNLVSNAAEATPSKGKIVISTANQYVDAPIEGYDDVEEGDYITLTVSDCGTGISTDEMERIFEPFYTKKVMGRSGTGIGMAVVWGTVKDHNGYIDVQSIEGKGTTFTIYFPITRETPGKDEHCLTFDDYKGEGEFILVVDDVKEQRNIAAEMLRKLGYSVKSVSSGNEAVAYLKDNSADLLVLDMIMDPGIDGLETYKRVVQLHPEQKAVIASGFSESENVKEAQKLGLRAISLKLLFGAENGQNVCRRN
jgi:signal transduction histidine kinase/CheY-like chemotaxis protein